MQLLDYIFGIIGAIGTGWGIVGTFKRKRLANVLKTILQTYPGDVAKIELSCRWAWANVTDCHDSVINVAEFAEKKVVLTRLNKAMGDSAAATRMCSLLFNQLLGFQQAQFDTRTVIHPETRELDLCKQEATTAQTRGH